MKKLPFLVLFLLMLSVATQVKATSQYTVALNWSAEDTDPGPTTYNVYRATAEEGPYTELTHHAPIDTTFYDDDTAVSGTTYWYTVTTLNGDKKESHKSAPVKVEIP